jgi:type IV secretion system protein VirD4
MVSRQETARQLLTPGEVMQLPADEEIILLSGTAPIKANKITYYTDKNFTGRVMAPPTVDPEDKGYAGAPRPQDCLWGQQIRLVDDRLIVPAEKPQVNAASNGGKERSPKIDGHKHTAKQRAKAESPAKDVDGQEIAVIELGKLSGTLSPINQAHMLTQSDNPELGI